MTSINFSPKSTLGFLTAVSFITWIGGMLSGLKQIESAGFGVFIVCFVIWMLFVFTSLVRNWAKF